MQQSAPMNHRRRSRLATAAVAALLVAGCATNATPAPATPAPTPAATSAAPSGSPDLAAVYTAIENEVAEIRGLPAQGAPRALVLSEDELRVAVKKQFMAGVTPEELTASQAFMRALGLIDPNASLEAIYLDMMTSQGAGFYDLKAKTISVVARSGGIGADEKVTFAHEFNHALQDQSFDLEGIRADSVGQGDTSIGQLAVVEGDATLLMSQWMLRLPPAEMAELLKGDPNATAELEKVPAFLRESLYFPYTQGLAFVMGHWMKGGWSAVDALYGALPVSSEQVLHPEKYDAGEKPVTVDLDAAAITAALGSGWTAAPLDVFGEFQVSAWLSARNASGVETSGASDAAAGWGGDRLYVATGPNEWLRGRAGDSLGYGEGCRRIPRRRARGDQGPPGGREHRSGASRRRASPAGRSWSPPTRRHSRCCGARSLGRRRPPGGFGPAHPAGQEDARADWEAVAEPRVRTPAPPAGTACAMSLIRHLGMAGTS